MFHSREVWKIVIIYAVFGSLWIVLSDQIFHHAFAETSVVVQLSIFKGMLFIGATSILLFLLIARQRSKTEKYIARLHATEERFQFLVENSSDCLLIINEEGHQKYVSHGAELMFGFKRAELEGKNIGDVVHPEDLPPLMNSWKSLLSGEIQTATIQYRHLHKNGNWVDCEAVARNFLEDPTIGGVIASVRDISYRKRSEQKLRQRNQFISTVLDNLPIGLAVNYIDEGTATYMNTKFEEIYGWPKEELQDMEDFFNKVYPNEHSRRSIKQRVVEDIRSGDPQRMQWTDLQITTCTGQNKIIEAKNIPLYEQGLMISTVQDVTETRRMQNQLEQAHKLESIGRLAGGVAHDLNNLLTPILGYSDILRDGAVKGEEVHKAAREISRAGGRARDLVRQLLAFSRKQVMEFKTVDINEIIESFGTLLRRTIPEDIDIRTCLDDDQLLVNGDAGQIEQALMNLAVNAADAMAKGGSLTIETAKIELDQAAESNRQGVLPGTYVMLAVSDTGCGMDEDTTKNIFEPFFSTKGEQGTGLGLATVYGIVKQHGGNILVYSEVDRGTTFKIYLPVSTETMVARAAAPETLDLEGSETILIAEDDLQVRQLACSVLARRGYTVLEAENGRAALNAADRHRGPIHLLLTDVVMPGINGRELYEKLTTTHPQVKVLFMSGYTENVVAHRGVLDEDVEFIQKPFNNYSLARKVKEVLCK